MDCDNCKAIEVQAKAVVALGDGLPLCRDCWEDCASDCESTEE